MKTGASRIRITVTMLAMLPALAGVSPMATTRPLIGLTRSG